MKCSAERARYLVGSCAEVWILDCWWLTACSCLFRTAQVLINTIGMAAATSATVWMVAPTRSYGTVHKFPWQQVSSRHEMAAGVVTEAARDCDFFRCKRTERPG